MPRKREFPDCDCDFDPVSGEGNMKFINCDIPLPSGGGAYVVDSGCGSGKSTVIRKIIVQKYLEGILVVVPTMEECDKLENEINTLNPLINVGKLHSKSDLLTQFLSDPACISKYSVLIITHIRLFINDWALFLRLYDPTLKHMNREDWKLAMKGKGDRLRKWIFIDELATFIKPMAVLSSLMIQALSFTDKYRTHNGMEGRLVEKGYYQHIYDPKMLKIVYKNQISDKFFKGKNNLSDYMTETVLDHIDKHRNEIVEAKGDYILRNRIQDYIFPSMQPKIVIFDGTGEPIFREATNFKLLKPTEKPYNSDITFREFKMPVKRDSLSTKTDNELNELADEMKRQTDSLLPADRILFICWKNIRIQDINRYSKEFKEDEDTKSDKFDLVKILTQKLQKRKVPESRFAIIYRGSGRDKAVNDYKDFAAVSFLGEWKVPKDIVPLINTTYGCKCAYQDFRLTQMIQAICRIRIREHNDQPVTVFYSSDISLDLMGKLFKYFQKHSSGKISGISSPSPKSRRETRHIFSLISLYSYDSKIRDSVFNDTPYSFSITLEELSKRVPMKRDKRKWESYDSLIKFLKKRYSIVMSKK